MNKQEVQALIQNYADTIIDVGDRIWEYAETAFTEYKSVEIVAKCTSRRTSPLFGGNGCFSGFDC